MVSQHSSSLPGRDSCVCAGRVSPVLMSERAGFAHLMAMPFTEPSALILSFPVCVMTSSNWVPMALPTVPFLELSPACLLSPQSAASENRVPSSRLHTQGLGPSRRTPLPAPIFVSWCLSLSLSSPSLSLRGFTYSVIHSFLQQLSLFFQDQDPGTPDSPWELWV